MLCLCDANAEERGALPMQSASIAEFSALRPEPAGKAFERMLQEHASTAPKVVKPMTVGERIAAKRRAAAAAEAAAKEKVKAAADARAAAYAASKAKAAAAAALAAAATAVSVPAPVAKAKSAAAAEKAARIEAAALLPLKERNHYDVLGLNDDGPDATVDQIRRAYRRLVLKYHPDKRATSGDDDRTTNSVFLAIKKAFEILGDEHHRREFDSRFDFDDSIPSGKETFETDEEYFDLYRPVFRRNARFANVTPVPDIGDASTPMDEVEAFYSYWFSFSSWREFNDKDEHDPEMADSRDERRWMQLQNVRVRAKLKAAENDRVQKLVSRANTADPRIRAAKRAEREEKTRAARERIAQREAEKDAAAERKRAAEQAEKDAVEAEKAAAEAAKIRLRDARRALRAICLPLTGSGREIDVEVAGGGTTKAALTGADMRMLAARLDAENIEALVAEAKEAMGPMEEGAALDPASDAAAAAMLVMVNRTTLERDLMLEEAAAMEAKLSVSKNRVTGPSWSSEELSALAKAMKRFPGGIKGRWDAISLHINSLGLPFKRTAKDCIGKAEAIRSGAADVPKEKPAPVAVAAAAEADAASGAGDDTPSPAASEKWTKEQQKALEEALRKHPSSKSVPTKERWTAVAALVPGKSMKDCAARYKELRAKLKAKAAAKAAKAAK